MNLVNGWTDALLSYIRERRMISTNPRASTAIVKRDIVEWNDRFDLTPILLRFKRTIFTQDEGFIPVLVVLGIEPGQSKEWGIGRSIDREYYILGKAGSMLNTKIVSQNKKNNSSIRSFVTYSKKGETVDISKKETSWNTPWLYDNLYRAINKMFSKALVSVV